LVQQDVRIAALVILVLLFLVSAGCGDNGGSGAGAAAASRSTLSSKLPKEIPGNVLWLDGSDVDGDTSPGGSFEAGIRWIDKSAAGSGHASQTDASRLPAVLQNQVNGLAAVHFDGSDFMDLGPGALGMLSNVEGATLYAVVRTEVTTPQRVFMVSTGANSGGSRAGVNLFDSFGASLSDQGDFGAAGRRLDTDEFQRIDGGVTTVGVFVAYTAVFDYKAGTIDLLVNGQLVNASANFQTPGATSRTDSLNIRAGADADTDLRRFRGAFKGDVGEILVYNRALSAAERRQLDDYLKAKWGL
jgi:hypothetical protein